MAGGPEQHAVQQEDAATRRAELLGFAVNQGLFAELVKIVEANGNLNLFKMMAIQRAEAYDGPFPLRNYRQVFLAWVTVVNEGSSGVRAQPVKGDAA